jgi:serine/threonine protein phosphatase PrpC
MLTRSFGDASLKRYMDSSPEVRQVARDARARFLVAGSDGLWSNISLAEVCEVLEAEGEKDHLALEIYSFIKRKRRPMLDNTAITVLRLAL